MAASGGTWAKTGQPGIAKGVKFVAQASVQQTAKSMNLPAAAVRDQLRVGTPQTVQLAVRHSRLATGSVRLSQSATTPTATSFTKGQNVSQSDLQGQRVIRTVGGYNVYTAGNQGFMVVDRNGVVQGLNPRSAHAIQRAQALDKKAGGTGTAAAPSIPTSAAVAQRSQPQPTRTANQAPVVQSTATLPSAAPVAAQAPTSYTKGTTFVADPANKPLYQNGSVAAYTTPSGQNIVVAAGKIVGITGKPVHAKQAAQKRAGGSPSNPLTAAAPSASSRGTSTPSAIAVRPGQRLTSGQFTQVGQQTGSRYKVVQVGNDFAVLTTNNRVLSTHPTQIAAMGGASQRQSRANQRVVQQIAQPLRAGLTVRPTTPAISMHGGGRYKVVQGAQAGGQGNYAVVDTQNNHKVLSTHAILQKAQSSANIRSKQMGLPQGQQPGPGSAPSTTGTAKPPSTTASGRPASAAAASTSTTKPMTIGEKLSIPGLNGVRGAGYSLVARGGQFAVVAPNGRVRTVHGSVSDTGGTVRTNQGAAQNTVRRLNHQLSGIQATRIANRQQAVTAPVPVVGQRPPVLTRAVTLSSPNGPIRMNAQRGTATTAAQYGLGRSGNHYAVVTPNGRVKSVHTKLADAIAAHRQAQTNLAKARTGSNVRAVNRSTAASQVAVGNFPPIGTKTITPPSGSGVGHYKLQRDLATGQVYAIGRSGRIHSIYPNQKAAITGAAAASQAAKAASAAKKAAKTGTSVVNPATPSPAVAISAAGGVSAATPKGPGVSTIPPGPANIGVKRNVSIPSGTPTISTHGGFAVVQGNNAKWGVTDPTGKIISSHSSRDAAQNRALDNQIQKVAGYDQDPFGGRHVAGTTPLQAKYNGRSIPIENSPLIQALNIQPTPWGGIYPNPTVQTHQGNGVLYKVLDLQGYTAKPELLSKKELDVHVAQGERELYRSVATKAQTDQFRTGDLYAGNGIYGNGTYVAATTQGSLKSARSESRDYGSVTMRMTLRKDARVIEHKKAMDDMATWKSSEMSRIRKLSPADQAKAEAALHAVTQTLGEWVAWMGDYDVIYKSGGNGKGSTFRAGGNDYYVILNRSAVRVQDVDD